MTTELLDPPIDGSATAARAANPLGLPDPDDAAADAAGRPVVVYDGQCVFCRAGMKRLRAMDLTGRLTFLSLHDPRVGRFCPNRSAGELNDEMVIVAPDGTQHGGADALKYLTRTLPLMYPAMPVLHFPGTAWLWRAGYRQLAKRRYSIAGKMCDDTCKIS